MSERKTETRSILAEKEEIFGNEVFPVPNNKIWISGIIEDEFEFSHEVFGESFFKTRVKVKRDSGQEDFIPITISERLTDLSKLEKGTKVEAGGQLRTYNKHNNDGSNHLVIYLFVRVINVKEEDEITMNDENIIYLDGYICKPPIYRKTPLGREIADLLIAVNRPYGKSDYIPCIAWGRNARWASSFEVGNNIEICGRIQSREYLKRYSPDSEEGEKKMAYEVSINKLNMLEV